MTQRKFSLAVVLAGGQQTGGGYHQAVTNLRMLLRSLPEDFSVTVVDSRGSFSQELDELVSQGLMTRATIVSLPRRLTSLRDRVLTDSGLLYQFARALLRLSGREVKTSVLARYLDTTSADLVYFASPAPEAADLMIKPFVWTLWDLCHLDSPEFPEVRTSGKFEVREDFNSRAVRKASLVVVDSTELIEKAVRYFGVREEKFVTIPFAPPVTREKKSSAVDNLPDAVRSLAGKYFFYPAQLWTHKNHVRIVEALREINDAGHDYHAVFVGKDHGAGDALRREVSRLSSEERVHFLGYVEDAAIPALYENSLALVMASYFGPTNIPPLEAMLLNTPVIASDVHQAQLNSAALYFDPDDSHALAERMIEVAEPKTRQRLIKAGQARLKELDRLRQTGEKALIARLVGLGKRIVRP